MAQLFFPEDDVQKATLIRWTCQLLPRAADLDPEMCEPIGVLDPTRQRLLAVAIFHNYMRAYDRIEITAASKSPRWCSRGAIRALLHYPFVQLGCRKLEAYIECTNEPALAFARRVGMVREGVLRHHFDTNAHGHVYTMMAKEYRKSRWAPAVELETV